ncbi:Glu/Leu/Phe/Val dehydrogenase dimerization domain-containing protein [Shigella boydii]
MSLLERLVKPERVIQFRVVWVDDRNQVQVNRAWRVQFSSAISRIKAVCASIRQLTSPFSIPRLRTNLQKCPDYPADGRW